MIDTATTGIEGASVSKLVYSVPELAGLLGISRGSAYTYVREGHIRSINIGGRIIIPKQALDDLLTVGSKAS